MPTTDWDNDWFRSIQTVIATSITYPINPKPEKVYCDRPSPETPRPMADISLEIAL
jgi:hypothetical protein